MRLLPLLLLFPVLAALAFALSDPDRPALVAMESGKPQSNLFGWRRPRPFASSSSSSSVNFGEEQDSRRPHLDSIDSTAAIVDDEIRGRRTWSKLARLEVVEWSSEEKLEYQTGQGPEEGREELAEGDEEAEENVEDQQDEVEEVEEGECCFWRRKRSLVVFSRGGQEGDRMA